MILYCAFIYAFRNVKIFFVLSNNDYIFIDHRTGPCYTGIKGALCTNQLHGVVCTKNLCCASVGKAWGHPCEHCPSHMECEHGFLKNIRSQECVGVFTNIRSPAPVYTCFTIFFTI